MKTSSKSKRTRVIGVDPGYGRLGVAVIESGPTGEKLIFSRCLTTAAELAFPERLAVLGREFLNWCRRYRPNYFALENLFFGANRKTAIKVAGVCGLLLYLAQSCRLQIIELNPLEVKTSICGYGQAKKNQVAAMVKRLLSLNSKAVRQDDEFDAMAIALTALALIHRKF